MPDTPNPPKAHFRPSTLVFALYPTPDTCLKHVFGHTRQDLCFNHPVQGGRGGRHARGTPFASLTPAPPIAFWTFVSEQAPAKYPKINGPLPLHSSGGGQAPVRACLPPLPPLPSRLEWKSFQSWSGPKSPNLVLASSKMFWRRQKSRFLVLDRIPQHGYSTLEEKMA